MIAVAVAFGMLGIFFPMTLFLQGALGFSPIRAGLTMTPMSIMIMIAAPLSGRLSDKIGARWILVTGLTLMSVGILLIITQINLDSTRNIGQVLGIAVLGSLLQSQLAAHTADEIANVPLDRATKDRVVEIARGSQFELLPQVVPAELMPQVFQGIQLAFVDSLHTTFLFGAGACAIGAVSALFIRNMTAAATAPRSRETIEATVVPGAD